MKDEIARPKVILDGKQAEDELKKLTELSKKLKTAMFEAAAAGDTKKESKLAQQFKSVNSEMNTLKKLAFDVEKVLKNINGASFNEIAAASRKAAADFKKMGQTDPGYAKAGKDAELLKTKMREMNKVSGTSISSWERFKITASGLLPAFGFVAIAAGAKVAFDKVISATDALGTEWEASVNGMKEGLNELWRTIATGDWTNLTTRMSEAIKIGSEYVKTLDDIEEKTRALDIIEVNSRRKILELEEALRNKTLTPEQRIKSGQERIKIENDLAAHRTKIAQETFDNESNLTAMQTKLSKEELMNVVGDIDSATKVRAKAFNEQVDQYEKLKSANVRSVGGGNAGGGTIVSNTDTPEMIRLKQLMDGTSQADRLYASTLRATGRTTDEQLDKMVSSYVKLIEAQDSAKENTKKVTTQVNSLLAGQDSEGQKLEGTVYEKKIKAAKKLSDDLTAFLEKDAVAQKDAINKYFHEAGEGAFDEFMKAIEAKQNEGTIDFSILPDAKVEEDKKDPTLDYAVAKYQESVDYQLLLNETLHDNGLRGEQEYQDELTRLTKKGEEERLQKKEDSLETAKQLSQFGLNFVSAMMDLELQNAGDNEEKKNQIRKKYAKIQFLVTASQIVVDTASAIMKALAELGPIAGAIAAGIVGATGAVQLATAYGQMGAVEGYKAGGFTNIANTDDEVVDYVHSNEFVANAKAVRNPTVRPFLDIINLAQKDGSISNINFPDVSSAVGYISQGRKSGGYSSVDMDGYSAKTISPIDQMQNGLLTEIANALRENTNQSKRMESWNPSIAIETYERKKDNWYKTKNGGLK